MFAAVLAVNAASFGVVLSGTADQIRSDYGHLVGYRIGDIAVTVAREAAVTLGTLGVGNLAAHGVRWAYYANAGLSSYQVAAGSYAAGNGIYLVAHGQIGQGLITIGGGALQVGGGFVGAWQAIPGARPSAYSSVYRIELPENVIGTSRAAHAAHANARLIVAMDRDPQLAACIEAASQALSGGASTGVRSALQRGNVPPFMRWHHGAADRGTLDLVPLYQHTHGSQWWDILHPGGRGGYSRWAIPAGAQPNY